MGKLTDIGKSFEKALFSGDREGLNHVLSEEVFYEMSGSPPIGGRFEGRKRVIDSFENRETGLGPGFEYEELSREWYADKSRGKIFVEIHERSWLPNHPDDVLEVRTCSVITVAGGQIVSIIDYTDSQAYVEFKERYGSGIPKFAS